MNRLAAFWDSSVGKKAVMAVTGIIGVLFVIGHMVGNLQVFQGAERLNAYGHLLHGPLNELVWGARVVLLVALVLHVVAAWQLDHAEPGGAAGGVRDQDATGVDAGLAHAALGRGAAAGVHRLSPARPDDRDGEPGVPGGRRLRQPAGLDCSAR